MMQVILACVLAIACLYLYGFSIMFLTNLIVDARHKKEGQQPADSIKRRAQKLIKTDPRVKKIYIILRLMYLKNKKSHNIDLLEQQLRTLVREKAVRQEIIHMVRAKPPI